MLPFALEIILLAVGVILPNFMMANNYSEGKSFTEGEMSLNTFFDLIRKRMEFNECRNLNLNISAVSNHKNYFLDVSFEVSESKYKDCFDYYNISLRKFKKKDETAVVVKYDKNAGASYRFKNVECGSYNLSIQTCSSSWVCQPFIVTYQDLVNMTGIECLGFQVSHKLLSQQQGKRIIVIITIVSVMLILIVGAVSFCFYWSGERNVKWKDFSVKKRNGTVRVVEDVDHFNSENKEPLRRNEIIILHHYNEVNNSRVYLLKDILQKTDYFESVTTIKDSLSKILFHVENWLNKMLETTKVDGGIRKIILIASESDMEAKDHEMENLVFSKFLDRINDDPEKFLKGYDHLFVVKFEKQLANHPEKYRNVVRRVRFILSEELFEDHLTKLCLNLCSESEQNYPDIERNLRELFSRHLMWYEENALLDV